MAAMTTDTPVTDEQVADKTAEIKVPIAESAEVTTSSMDTDAQMVDETTNEVPKQTSEKEDAGTSSEATASKTTPADGTESQTTPFGPTESMATPPEVTQSKLTPAEVTASEPTPAEATESTTTPSEVPESNATPTESIESEPVPSEEKESKTASAAKPENDTSVLESVPAIPEGGAEASKSAVNKPAKESDESRISILTPAKRKRSPSPPTSPSRLLGDKADDNGSVSSDNKEPPKKRKRNVSFDGVTVFYFRRSQGFTSVPSQGGSTLGMARQHEALEKFSLGDYAIQQEKAHRRILKRQMLERRQQQLVELGCTEFDREISDADLDEELKSINVCDYYFLQPIPTKQRRQLLRTAGVKKIDNMEKVELKRIRASRESCGCDCRVFCDPETCACSIAGIKCQVDRLSFPCGCTKDGCGNLTGRIEFNPARVRTHFIHTLMRIDIEKDQNGFVEDPQNGDLYHSTVTCSSLVNKTNPSVTDSSICMQGSIHNGEQGSTFSASESSSCMSGSVYSGQPGFSGNYPAAEGNMEIKQRNMQDVLPRMLHFSDSDDEMTNQQLESQCNVSLPPMPPYESSEESYSSSSSESSCGENYQYIGSSNFGLASGAAYGMMDENAGADLCMPSMSSSGLVAGGNLPVSPDEGAVAKLTPLESTSELTPMSTCATFTDLSPTVSCSGGFGDIVTTSASSSCDLAYGESTDKDSMCNVPSSTDLLATNSTQNCSSTSNSGFTVLSAMTAIDPLEEMRETALATSSISSVTVGMGDHNVENSTSHLGYANVGECGNGVIGQMESEESNISELSCDRGASPCLPSDTCETIGEALLACRDSKLLTNHTVPLPTSVQQ